MVSTGHLFLLLSRSTTKNLTADDSKKEKIIEKEVWVVLVRTAGFPEIKKKLKKLIVVKVYLRIVYFFFVMAFYDILFLSNLEFH
jgi:hypothetical protein